MLFQKRLKNIRLVVADIDGTLLTNSGIFPGGIKEQIKELNKNGVIFSFASGRTHSSLTELVEGLNIKAPVISLDGTLVKDFSGKKALFESFIPRKQVIRALNYCGKLYLNIALCHAEAVYYTDRNSVIPQLMNKFGTKYVKVESYDNYLDRVLEIAITGDTRENISFVRDRMRFPYSPGLKSFMYKSYSNEGVYYLEIRKKGANKGKALIKLCNSLNVKLSETAVIGDWHNDISLFHPKVFKVTLSNGIPELKRMADIVLSKDNNEEGATEFFELLLYEKR